ncbi:MAG TPA: Ig-like domain-containing protein [Myxococcota bacterium]|jgi:hypothetical protein|nr:Ig-like domain-containing protein [Myxococcota bacterium]
MLAARRRSGASFAFFFALALAACTALSACTVELPSHSDLANDTVLVTPPPGSVAKAVSSGPVIVYLNLDGGSLNCNGEDSRTNSSYVICNVSYPAFSTSGFTCGSLEQCKDAFVTAEQDLWAEWNIVFTKTRPTSGNYEMVMVGGNSGGGAAGVAPLDCGNFNPNDIAFAFSEVVAFGACSFNEVVTTIAQELGHALGMCHNADTGSVMYPAIASCMPDWGCGAQIDSCGCEGLGYDPFCPATAFDSLLGPAVDDMPPTITFVGPTDGASVAQAFDVTVNAVDERGVANVYLYVNGVLAGMDDTQPYEWTVNAPGTGPLDLEAWVWDTGDNSANAAITVDVVDPSDLGDIGAPCSANGECASNICATRGTEGRCTETCTSPADCPASFTCDSAGSVNVCWPPDGYMPPRAGCGCVVAGADAPGTGGGTALLGAGLLLGLLLVRPLAARGRRRRTG